MSWPSAAAATAESNLARTCSTRLCNCWLSSCCTWMSLRREWSSSRATSRTFADLCSSSHWSCRCCCISARKPLTSLRTTCNPSVKDLNPLAISWHCIMSVCWLEASLRATCSLSSPCTQDCKYLACSWYCLISACMPSVSSSRGCPTSPCCSTPAVTAGLLSTWKLALATTSNCRRYFTRFSRKAGWAWRDALGHVLLWHAANCAVGVWRSAFVLVRETG
mmetsp:Transcript_68803/g.190480  ORF Transcript_68803/g.190480 Transcript_68803/m.190480 type:complete len:221 (-) Transcript_68803:117-779(-)